MMQGQLYLSKKGMLVRQAVRQIAIEVDSPDVVVVETCQELHGEHLLPENLELCEDLARQYGEYDYGDLMNTTFALIPAGRSPATYRLAEALSAGAIPVMIHSGFVKPFPDRIPWRLFSMSFPIEEAPGIIDVLRSIPEPQLAAMQVCHTNITDDATESLTQIRETPRIYLRRLLP